MYYTGWLQQLSCEWALYVICFYSPVVGIYSTHIILSRYLVFCDPAGPKIGNGGATMHVLQEMEQLLGWECLKTGEECTNVRNSVKKLVCTNLFTELRT